MKTAFVQGDRVRNRNARPGGCKTGVVISVTSPNTPWHDGGKPYVQPDDGGPAAYWYDAEKVEADDEAR